MEWCPSNYSNVDMQLNFPSSYQSSTKPGLLGQSNAPSDWHSGCHGSILHSATYLSKRFGHEIISTAILSLSLIQERQLSVTGESMGT